MIKAYCINLDRKPEQFKQVSKEFEGILDIERVSAIDGLANGISGATALFNTQIQLFEKLIQTSDKYAIVIEDDVYRLPKFSEYWPQIVDFISKSSNWDFISLDFLLCLDSPTLERYNSFFYKTSCCRMTGFIIYNTNFLKKNLNSLREKSPLDMSMTFNKDYIKLIPKDLIVRQYTNKKSDTNVKDNTMVLYELFYKRTIEYLKTHTENTA